jgi:outer membrane receptor protein involved in Fe transport
MTKINVRSRSALRIGLCTGFLLLLLAPHSHAQQSKLHGTVLDSTGAPIQDAEIEFDSGTTTALAATDAEGKFSLSGVTGSGKLLARYPGLSPAAVAIGPDSYQQDLELRLSPAPSSERIQVSAEGEDRIPPVPSSEFSIPTEQREVSGALVIDDVLREAPGFTLFRRSGSLFANPTSQGVSLRGMGASGASRAVVLLDGIPLNDPFGGWVYWDRIPNASIETMQVLNGGASDVYGGGALGGVVNLQSRSDTTSFASLETSYGTLDTPYLSFDGGVNLHNWELSAAVQTLRTHGYILVPAGQRGLIDTDAGTGDLSGTIQLAHNWKQNGRFFVRASSFGESRQNGTPLQTNSTRIPEVDLGGDWNNATVGAFSIRVYGSDEIFNQNFSSIALNRNSEALTDVQRSPSQQIGFALQWQRVVAKRHNLTAGVEDRDVRGHSAETTFSGRPTANVDAGGRQRITGFFVQDAFYFARNWLLTLGAREDEWLNSRGFSSRIPLPKGAATLADFPNRTENAFSPRISLLRALPRNVAVSASVYRSFRPPTLNELYRNFRVGNVVTNANSSLTSERLTGGEIGVSARQWEEKLTLRGNLFWSDIDHAVENVTLSTTPTLITQQRQNLGTVRARGAELSAELLLPSHLRLSGGYILTDSKVLSFTPNPLLVGLRVPQVPRNEVNIQLSYLWRNWTAGVQGRFVGKQYDDDLNTFPLDSYFTLDAEASRRILPHATFFAAAQNLTATRYQTERTPVLQVGPPVLARAGFRFDFGPR